MTSREQTILAVVLFVAAGLLLARQIYRRIRGKDSGCSCSLPPRREEEKNSEDSQDR